jgi:HSP20 family molecular chaperone IbpA
MSNEAVKVRENNNPAAAQPARGRRTVAPFVDVFENTNEVLVVADVPGVAADALDIRVENDTLTIETKRAPSQDAPALGREYEEFEYARSFRIPAGIDAANVNAELKNGTLSIHLPKVEAAKPRKITVRSN